MARDGNVESLNFSDGVEMIDHWSVPLRNLCGLPSGIQSSPIPLKSYPVAFCGYLRQGFKSRGKLMYFETINHSEKRKKMPHSKENSRNGKKETASLKPQSCKRG